MQKKDFPSLGLSNWLVSQVTAVGYKNPTPVQENCIPPILEGEFQKLQIVFFYIIIIIILLSILLGRGGLPCRQV